MKIRNGGYVGPKSDRRGPQRATKEKEGNHLHKRDVKVGIRGKERKKLPDT